MTRNRIEIINAADETITFEDFVEVEIEDGCISIAMPAEGKDTKTHYYPLNHVNNFVVTESE